MTGTIIVTKKKSLDIRTIDFELIVKILRSRAENSSVAKKLLQSVDEFGMDMICADELEREEFLEFYSLLVDLRAHFANEQGLAEFLDAVCQVVRADKRLTG